MFLAGANEGYLVTYRRKDGTAEIETIEKDEEFATDLKIRLANFYVFCDNCIIDEIDIEMCEE
jgi:hypothetical protein